MSSDCGLRLRRAWGVSGAGGDEGDSGRNIEFRGVISSSCDNSGRPGKFRPVEAHGVSAASLMLFPGLNEFPEFSFIVSDVLTIGAFSPLSPFRCTRLSSITASTPRNFDSDLRWVCDTGTGAKG